MSMDEFKRWKVDILRKYCQDRGFSVANKRKEELVALAYTAYTQNVPFVRILFDFVLPRDGKMYKKFLTSILKGRDKTKNKSLKHMVLLLTSVSDRLLFS